MGLHLYDLTKRYVSPDGSAVPVINVPRFDLGDGEQVALVGGSGTGKTTLLHLIAGILAPDGGRIVYDNLDGESSVGRSRDAAAAGTAGAGTGTAVGQAVVSTGSGAAAGGTATAAPPATTAVGTLPYRVGAAPSSGATDIARLSESARDVFRGRYVGYIFQTHHLLPGFTALENVLLGMSFTGRSADPTWARHLLGEVGLSDRLHYVPEKLSVGQQQRVAVARALANRPRLVLADEPTGALDPANAQSVLDLVRRLCAEVGAGLLLVSHDPQITRQLPRAVMLAEMNRVSK
ncbi:MAG: Lipoprotein releasing system ATP-binding protein LolD [uncultured Phycisphaerae bacterium]|uniref:Lipoprotein releasing system ATP-binding protein LolD n=1 Tax=uncultured Phycisphaerae bacterium TaxID=904963 RepID=A0A6J4P8G1_9BACT|nr:MAG: Lipoprotein releasing system ATP-binding protein LolD [uncultured Phycisphaerae bacterium]